MKRKPKAPPRDLRLDFMTAGLAEGFSEAQLRFLWNATERRPRPTNKLEKSDYVGLAGFVVLLSGVAMWSIPAALVLAGAVIVSLAWLSAAPRPPASPAPRPQ